MELSGETRNESTQICPVKIIDNETKMIQWRWDSLSIKGAGAIGYPYAKKKKKMDIELNLTPYIKVNSKWIGFKCET